MWELEQNAHKRSRNWVSSRNETGEQSTANCEILVVNVGVDAQNVSNIKKESITAQKGSGSGSLLKKVAGSGSLLERVAGSESLLEREAGSESLLKMEAGLGSLLKFVAGSGSLLKR